ncbi:hypothetical protein [Cellvibrio sp. NN19]
MFALIGKDNNETRTNLKYDPSEDIRQISSTYSLTIKFHQERL